RPRWRPDHRRSSSLGFRYPISDTTVARAVPLPTYIVRQGNAAATDENAPCSLQYIVFRRRRIPKKNHKKFDSMVTSGRKSLSPHRIAFNHWVLCSSTAFSDRPSLLAISLTE